MRKIMRLILLIALLLSLLLINYIRDYKYPSEDDLDKGIEEEELKIQEAMDVIKNAADRISNFTKLVGPKVNSTLDNVTQVIGEVSKFNVVTKDVWFQVSKTMANINLKFDNLNQKVEEASKAVTDDIWPHIKERMTNLSKNVDNVSDVLTHKVWFTVNETMGAVLRLLDVDKTSSSATPDIRLVTRFLVLCLALSVMLCAAYQTKKLLGSENNEGQAQRRSPNIVESIIIHITYWVCLVLASMLAITVFGHFFTHVVDQSQITWISLASKYIEDIPTLTHLDPKLLTIILLCSIILAFVFVQQWRAIFEYITVLTWFASYILFRLPIRLLLDPSYRAYGHLTSSCCKASTCLLLYTALCTILPSVYYYPILNESTEPMTLQNVLFFVYVPLYVMAFIVYLLATIFSWTLENIVLFLLTKKHCTDNEETLHTKHGRRYRINYRVQYYT